MASYTLESRCCAALTNQPDARESCGGGLVMSQVPLSFFVQLRLRLLATALLFALGIPFPAQASWRSIGAAIRSERIGEAVELSDGHARLRVTLLAPDLVRVRMTPQADFSDAPSWAVIKSAWPAANADFSESANAVTFTTSKLRVVVQKAPVRVSFYAIDGALIDKDDESKGMGWDGQQVHVWKWMPEDEHYYGFGEKAGPLDKRGQAMTMWNFDAFLWRDSTDPLYVSVPFFLALRKGRAHGIFFDNTYRSSFDMGKESSDYYSFGAEGGELDYYFIYGPHPKDVLTRFTELVGRMPLPPRWALGYHQCRYSYYPETRVREIADDFRRRRIPADAIWLDIDYMDGFRSFTWDRKPFPDFPGLIQDLARQHFKVVTIIDPAIKKDPNFWVYQQGVTGNHFCKVPDGSLFIGEVWAGESAFPDFTRPETRRWWAGLYKELVDLGVRGIWNDMDEPAVFKRASRTMPLEVQHNLDGHPGDHRAAHNLYGMQLSRATYEGLRALRPNERPFVLTRASFAGGHRYAAVWTGDNISNWDHLRLSVPSLLNLGLSGFAFAGPDVGGFAWSPSAELFTRWLQAGVFFPFLRDHTVKGSRDQEPWAYGPRHEALNRSAIELRYRLLPYLYALMEEAHRSGVPAMRPIFLEDPDDESVYSEDFRFLLGRSLLIAPVFSDATPDWEICLPRGVWFDFWTDKKYEGGKCSVVSVTLEHAPVFVRAGAVIPSQPVVQNTEEKPVGPLTLEVYPGGETDFTLYDDDGISYEFEKGAFARILVQARDSSESTDIVMAPRQGSYTPWWKSYLVRVHVLEQPPKRVSVNGKDLPGAASGLGAEQKVGTWFYDAATRVLMVHVEEAAPGETIRVLR